MNVIKGKINPLRDIVFVTNMEAGQRVTAGGIVIPDDDMKEHGIRSRWGQVWKVGPDVLDLKPGEWVLVQHGRWTNGIDVEDDNGNPIKIWRIDYPNGVDLVSDEFPLDVKPI